jgi:SET domain-containing protein
VDAQATSGQVFSRAEEYDGVLMRVNHSCEPNLGMGGNVLLVAMREIAAGEELTIDYALFLARPPGSGIRPSRPGWGAPGRGSSGQFRPLR